MQRFGYHGAVMHVDLGAGYAEIDEPADTFWRQFGGGGLLAATYLMRLTPPGIDPLEPANALIVTSSVMAGQPYVGLARCTVAAKSPMTGGMGETRCDGPFAAALKGSGVDTLVIQGQADRPLLLLIENGHASFADASALWGLPVSQTVDRLEEMFGAGIHTAVIGPAGETLVRFASIVTDRAYQAPRMGMGAVMGSKRLKAIVIRGEHFPAVADPVHCAELTERYTRRIMVNPLSRWQHEPPGFSAWVHTHGTGAALCTHNYRDSVFAGADVYQPSAYLEHYRHDGVCPGCPNNCFKFFGTSDDDRYDPRAGAIHQEITVALGPNLGIADVEFIFKREHPL